MPIQFAYRVRYNNVVLILEIATIVVYLYDAYSRYNSLVNINKILSGEDLEMDEKKEKIKNWQPEQVEKFRSEMRSEIIFDIISFVPFSLFFSIFDAWEPWYVIDIICSLRILKLNDVFKFF